MPSPAPTTALPKGAAAEGGASPPTSPGRDFRPPKFNSPGGSRKPSAERVAPWPPLVPPRRGEVPEGPGSGGHRRSHPSVLFIPGRPPAPSRVGRAPHAVGERRRVGRGSVPGAAGRGRAPPPATAAPPGRQAAQVNQGGLAAAAGVAVPRKFASPAQARLPLCKPRIRLWASSGVRGTRWPQRSGSPMERILEKESWRTFISDQCVAGHLSQLRSLNLSGRVLTALWDLLLGTDVMPLPIYVRR
jgi:hypothetical protein